MFWLEGNNFKTLSETFTALEDIKTETYRLEYLKNAQPFYDFAGKFSIIFFRHVQGKRTLRITMRGFNILVIHRKFVDEQSLLFILSPIALKEG